MLPCAVLDSPVVMKGNRSVHRDGRTVYSQCDCSNRTVTPYRDGS